MPILSPSELALVGATFLASAVEIVETFTILLAMGLTRGWRSTIAGAVTALALLAVVTVVAGYTILRLIPESLLQLVIGTLLLVFGMQWLRKAILRSAGRKGLHDEEAIFAAETAAGRAAGEQQALFGLDGFAFVVAFKGVLLEGLEVVVIVLTFGISAGNVPLAAAGALLAIIPVTVLVVIVRGPLSRVPENTIKYVVGLLLTTFGTFWAVEGLGAVAAGAERLEWPLGDLMLVAILGTWIVVSRVLVAVLRQGPAPVADAA